MENSQSLLLHKSTHHFDIVNWFLEDEPKLVTALANRVYYGDLSKSYSNRCSTCKKSDKCV
jgi:predicted dehydrogenase